MRFAYGNRWTLYNADCFEVLPQIAAKSIDAVITDPPYAIPTQVAQGRNQTTNAGDLSISESAMRELFKETHRCLSDSGRHFVFCDGVFYPSVFRAMYGKSACALLVWDKLRIGMGREFRKQHELVLHAWKNGTPIVESGGVGHPDILRCLPVSPNARIHAAEKPVPLIRQLLRVCGGSILDPYAGSAAVGEAAILENRNFIGIEICPDNYEKAVDRLRRLDASTSSASL
jgi:DNA modification methylase